MIYGWADDWLALYSWGFAGLHDALELQAAAAEIDQQAHLQTIGFKVIDGLRQMDIFQLDHRFDLNHYLVFDKEIHPPVADFGAFVENIHLMFTAERQSLLGHFDVKGALVDHLLETIPERLVDFHGTADDLAGQFGVKVFFVNHCLLVWNMISVEN